MVRLPDITSNAREAMVEDFSGGVNYSCEPHKIKDNQLSELCNMEYKNGVLAKRSGYEEILSEDSYGAMLAAKEINGILYFACEHVIGKLDLLTREITLLAKNKQFTENGSFLVKEDEVFYFSGAGIYRYSEEKGTFHCEAEEMLSGMVLCELAENIYTDGNMVYDFAKGTAAPIDSGETFAFLHICAYETTPQRLIVYGIEKESALDRETRIVGIVLEHNGSGYTYGGKVCDATGEFPFHSGTAYITNCGNYITKMFAVKDTLFFQCHVALEDSATMPYAGYFPAVARYNLISGAFETDSVSRFDTSNSDSCIYELCDHDGETVYTVQRKLRNGAYSYLNVKDYGSGEILASQKQFDFMEIDDDVSSNNRKDGYSYMNMVDADMFTVTYQKDGIYQTKLFRYADHTVHTIDHIDRFLGFLLPMDGCFYSLNVIEKDFCRMIGFADSQRIVEGYSFSENGISFENDAVTDADLKSAGYTFGRMDGHYVRFSSSCRYATKTEGYIPAVLAAQWIESNGQYETVSGEEYNALSNKCKVVFSDAVSSEVCEIVLPFHYSQVKEIFTGHNGEVEYERHEDSILVTKDCPFVLGEELFVVLYDHGEAKAPEKCHLAVVYGGTSSTEGSGTRVYAAGNEQQPEAYYVSELNRFDYFPDLNIAQTEDSGQRITGFAKHYQDLIVFKNHSISVIAYSQTDSDFLPIRRIHDALGCDMPGTIQIINNDIVFGNSEKGLFLLSLHHISSERNVKPIGLNISGAVNRFTPPDRRKAKSVDFKNRYFLGIGDRVYIWDYELRPYSGDQEKLAWFEYRNVNAEFFFPMGEQLAFCERGKFAVQLFDGGHNDNGEAIESFFTTKAFDFGDGSSLKAVHQIWLTMRSNTPMELSVQCEDEAGRTRSMTVPLRSPTLSNAIALRTKVKRFLYVSFRFGNAEKHTNYEVSGLKLEYEHYKSRR